MFIATHINGYSNSAIFNVFEEQKDLKLSRYYKHILFILLDSFSLRWSLYENEVEGIKFNQNELGIQRIDRLINNIRYVKMKLEEIDIEKTYKLNHHLSNLLLNILLVRYKVTREYIEVK